MTALQDKDKRMAVRRLRHELKVWKEIKEDGGFSWAEIQSNVENRMIWQVYLEGPPSSPYAGGKFHLTINYPDEYPYKKPTICFVTKVWSPGVSESTGFLRLDILKKWKPYMFIHDVIEELYKDFSDSFLKCLTRQVRICCSIGIVIENTKAQEQLSSDPELFYKQAQKWTRLYASSN